MATRPHPVDVDLLGLEVDDDGQSGRFVLGPGLVRHDGALYGGTGIAVAVAAMEAATDRDVLWTSTQFVSSPVLGSTIDWTVERLAVGKRATQLLVRATVAGTEGPATAFVAIGSTGIAADDGLTGQYVAMPAVGDPRSAPPRQQSLAHVPTEHSWGAVVEMREAEVLDDRGPVVAFWARLRRPAPFSPAVLAFIADFVPLGVARAAGKMGAGSSLDNSLRFRGGLETDTDWVLIALEGDFANGGFGHGTVRLWTEDGRLLGIGSQSASMRYLFDEGAEPNLPLSRIAEDAR